MTASLAISSIVDLPEFAGIESLVFKSASFLIFQGAGRSKLASRARFRFGRTGLRDQLLRHPFDLVPHLEPLPLRRDNLSRLRADQEVSLASVKDHEVVDFCTARIEHRPGTIRIDRVASSRRFIGPVLDFTVPASGYANAAARPISVEGVESNIGVGAAHDIADSRPPEGIGTLQAGNAAAAILGMNFGHGPWNARRWPDRCDQHDCRHAGYRQY